MSEYKLRYKGSSKEVEIEANSPRLAYNDFFKKIDYEAIPVEVWNGSSWITFDTHISNPQDFETLADKRERAEAKQAQEAAKHDQEKQTKIQLADQIKNSGLFSLKTDEFAKAINILDKVLVSKSPQELDLNIVRSVLSDQEAYNFLSLRSSAATNLHQRALLNAMNVKLGEISKSSEGIKSATMFAGFAAAKEIGESFGED
jgi:hypothetical protein